MVKPAKWTFGLAVLACYVLTGCSSAQPVTRQDMVGNYTYVSKDPANKPTDHTWDHLALNANGHYELVQGGPTKKKIETTGTWTIWKGGHDGPMLLLGQSWSYPIKIKHKKVKLMIDYDVGIWWAKTK